MNRRVIIIGGGVAGMQAALSLKKAGCSPMILEKDETLGGKLNGWDTLFPSMTPAEEVAGELRAQIEEAAIKVKTGCRVAGMHPQPNGKIEVLPDKGEALESEAVVIATGFDVFDATLKQEYGYGVYENVITSAELEAKLKNRYLSTAEWRTPKRIAFLHCVGSRDEQIGQRHCSRVCCITGVKQAIKVRRLLPDCEVYNFYMDIRMYGAGFEELYKESQQQWNVNYIRGKISEASQTIDGQIRIKAEDTLAGRPLRITVDLLVLLVGKTHAACNEKFAGDLSIGLWENKFFRPLDHFVRNTSTTAENVFLAGSCIAPKSVDESINDGASVAFAVSSYLDRINR